MRDGRAIPTRVAKWERRTERGQTPLYVQPEGLKIMQTARSRWVVFDQTWHRVGVYRTLQQAKEACE